MSKIKQIWESNKHGTIVTIENAPISEEQLEDFIENQTIVTVEFALINAYGIIEIGFMNDFKHSETCEVELVDSLLENWG